MATKKEREEKKDYARILFMQGDSQKVIAEKTGISAQTITKWVNGEGWQEQLRFEFMEEHLISQSLAKESKHRGKQFFQSSWRMNMQIGCSS